MRTTDVYLNRAAYLLIADQIAELIADERRSSVIKNENTITQGEPRQTEPSGTTSSSLSQQAAEKAGNRTYEQVVKRVLKEKLKEASDDGLTVGQP